MKKLVIAGLLALASITNAHAFDITVGGQPGGTSQKVSEAIAASLKEKNINVDIKYTQGCPVVKSNIENNKEKMVFITTALVMNLPDCSLDFSKNNVKVIDEIYTYTNALCYPKNRTDLGLQNFLNPKLNRTVAATMYTQGDFTKIVDKLGLTGATKIVNVGNSGKARAAILGTEFDYAIIDASWAATNNDKVDCLFIGTDEDAKLGDKKVLSLQKYLKLPKDQPVFQDVFILVGANMSDDEIKKVRSEMSLVRKSDVWKKYTSEFGNAEVTAANNKLSIILKALKGN